MQKQTNFMADQNLCKEVGSMPGINPILACRLTQSGYCTSDAIFGKYLMLNRDREAFVRWLCKLAGATAYQANLCFYCIKEWYETYIM